MLRDRLISGTATDEELGDKEKAAMSNLNAALEHQAKANAALKEISDLLKP